MNHKATSIWHILCHIPLALCKSRLLLQLHFHSHSVPVPHGRVGSGSSTWPVLWRRPVALPRKLQLIPKLRMKSNCSLAHSVVLRSALLLLLQPSPVHSLFVCSVVLFCFYILLTADYSSCSPHRCWRGKREHPTPPRQPTSPPPHLNSSISPQCMIFILRLSFIFLMSLYPTELPVVG